ncbi:hypothetical protein ACVWWO_000214 [Bradyrhizobium sp. F1.13.1]
MRAVVFGPNSRSVCMQYVFPPLPAIGHGCSIGANPAQNAGPPYSVKRPNRERTIQNNLSTFQQALCVYVS